MHQSTHSAGGEHEQQLGAHGAVTDDRDAGCVESAHKPVVLSQRLIRMHGPHAVQTQRARHVLHSIAQSVQHGAELLFGLAVLSEHLAEIDLAGPGLQSDEQVFLAGCRVVKHHRVSQADLEVPSRRAR